MSLVACLGYFNGLLTTFLTSALIPLQIILSSAARVILLKLNWIVSESLQGPPIPLQVEASLFNGNKVLHDPTLVTF